MFRFAMGNAPRSVRRPQVRPMQRVHLFSLSQGLSVVAEGRTEVTITLPPSDQYAGVYRIALADLAQGPICLVPATVTLSENTAVAAAGLWAYAANLGMPQGRRSWQVDGQTINSADEPVLPVNSDLAGRTLHYIETIQQGAMLSVSIFAPVEVPTQSVEQEHDSDQFGLVYLTDGTVHVGVDKTNPITFTLEPPHIHAGTYTLTAATLAGMAQGPICLVVPEIALDAAGENLTVTRIGLWAYDADLGEMAITRRWHKDGVAIDGQVSQTLTIADHRGEPLQHVERAVQPGLERLAASSAITLDANSLPADVYATGTANQSIASYVGASGEANTIISGTVTILSTGYLSTSNGALWRRGGGLGDAQFAESLVTVGTGNNSRGQGPAVRVQTGDDRFFAMVPRPKDVGGEFILYHRSSVGGAVVERALWPFSFTYGADVTLRLEAEGTTLRGYADGVLVGTHVDTSGTPLTDGAIGGYSGGVSSTFTTARMKTLNGGVL